VSRVVYEEVPPPRRRRGCWCFLVVLLALLVCVALVAGVINYLGSAPNTIEVTVVAPRLAGAGESFQVTVTIDNISLESQRINGVGIETDLLDGITVVRTDPPSAVEDHDIPLWGEWREYTLDTDLAAGSELVLTFDLQATTPGTYSGRIIVWIQTDEFGLSLQRAAAYDWELAVQEQ
jgi:hypothetical protein